MKGTWEIKLRRQASFQAEIQIARPQFIAPAGQFLGEKRITDKK